MSDEFDFEGLDKWEKRLLRVAEVDAPKEFKKAVRQAGNLLRRKVRRNTPKVTGELRRSYRVKMKRGKVYEAEVGTNVFYAKMVEEGHKTPDGNGFVEGKFYFRKAYEETERELPSLLKDTVRKLGKELGMDVTG